MERKFTDNEIVEALECCADGSGTGIIRATIDLINRQKAEIEDLDRNLKSAYSKIERLKKGWTADIVLTADAKAEAIKEFAERLKATPLRFRVEHTAHWEKPPTSKMVLFVEDSDIDSLVKEMTEGKP